jgi:hypothetical protein
MGKRKKKRTDRFLVVLGPTTAYVLAVSGPAVEGEYKNSGVDYFMDYMGIESDLWPKFGMRVYECNPVETKLGKEDDQWVQRQRYQEYDYSDGEWRELTQKEWAAIKNGAHPWEAKSLPEVTPSVPQLTEPET